MAGKKNPNLLDDVVDSVDRAARMVVGTMGKALRAPVSLIGTLLPALGEQQQRRIGAPPGIDQMPEIHQAPEPDTVVITCIDYGPGHCQTQTIDLPDLETFFAKPRDERTAVRWVNVDGLHPYVVNKFREEYRLHTLAAEDVLNTPQRPKLEAYGEDLFIVARMIMHRDSALHSEQTSFFLLDGVLLTFQETRGDVWDQVRERLHNGNARIRHGGADYLLYALIDAMVDASFPLLEAYSDELEDLEAPIMQNARPALLQRIHFIKRELAIVRRVLWPMREVLDELYGGDLSRVAEPTRPYLRDVYDHGVQILDIVETHREMATSLSDLYMNAMSNRMNEVMKVLTIMASLFIPISFLAGMWGMNVRVPGQDSDVGFWWVAAACLAITAGLLIYFRRKRWI
jgi:magnesium transporter